MEWYYILGGIGYGIFIIQFLISIIGIDSDLDVDLDGDIDFSVSDLISFKGLIHFIMGFSGWLMVQGNVSILNIIIACIIGVCFVVILYHLYKFAMKLQHHPKAKTGLELVGYIAIVYLTSSNGNECICNVFDGNGYKEIKCITSIPVKIGDLRKIIDFKDNIYYI